MLTTRVEPEIFVPPLPGRRGAPRRRATSATSALYFDRMERKLPDRARPRRRAAVRQPRVPRRHPRRARQHLRHLRRRDQDHLRHLPALLRCSTRACSAPRRRNTQGADLQREGRGPPLPRPRQRRASTDDDRERYRALGLAPGAVRPRRGLRAAPHGRPERGARRRRPARTASHAFYWTIEEFVDERAARRSCSPTPRTSASSTRWSCTTSPAALKRDGQRRRRRRRVGDRRRRRCARIASSSTSSSTSVERRRRRAREWAGPATGMGTINAFVRRLLSSQRPLGRLVRADVAAARAAASRSARPTRRSPSSTSTTSTTGPSASSSASRCAARSTTRKQPGSARPLLFVVLDELNKYAPPRGRLADQGDPARRRRARPLARHHPHRRAADRERGRAAHHLELVDPRRRPARRRRGAPRPSTGSCPTAHRQRATIAKPGTMFVQPARDPGAARGRVPVPGVGDPPVRAGRSTA